MGVEDGEDEAGARAGGGWGEREAMDSQQREGEWRNSSSTSRTAWLCVSVMSCAAPGKVATKPVWKPCSTSDSNALPATQREWEVSGRSREATQRGRTRGPITMRSLGESGRGATCDMVLPPALLLQVICDLGRLRHASRCHHVGDGRRRGHAITPSDRESRIRRTAEPSKVKCAGGPKNSSNVPIRLSVGTHF